MSSDCEGRTQEDIGKDIEEWRAKRAFMDEKDS